MQLLLVRHGQTQFNAERRYLGALDPELNAHGIDQARALRESLPRQLDAVLCSPLRRACQPAKIICDGRGRRDIAEQHKGQVVVQVAHGFVAKVVRAVSLAGFDDFFDWQLENGAVLALGQGPKISKTTSLTS